MDEPAETRGERRGVSKTHHHPCSCFLQAHQRPPPAPLQDPDHQDWRLNSRAEGRCTPGGSGAARRPANWRARARRLPPPRTPGSAAHPQPPTPATPVRSVCVLHHPSLCLLASLAPLCSLPPCCQPRGHELRPGPPAILSALTQLMIHPPPSPVCNWRLGGSEGVLAGARKGRRHALGVDLARDAAARCASAAGGAGPKSLQLLCPIARRQLNCGVPISRVFDFTDAPQALLSPSRVAGAHS